MEKAKFTKEQWKVFEYGKSHFNNDDLPWVTIHYGDNEEHIVDTVYELADAHLIAAAPDMYNLLDSIYMSMCNTGSDNELVSDISDLLAKARGE